MFWSLNLREFQAYERVRHPERLTAEQKHQRERSKLAATMANLALQRIRPGQEPPDFLPAWARKDFDMSGSLAERSLGR